MRAGHRRPADAPRSLVLRVVAHPRARDPVRAVDDALPQWDARLGPAVRARVAPPRPAAQHRPRQHDAWPVHGGAGRIHHGAQPPPAGRLRARRHRPARDAGRAGPGDRLGGRHVARGGRRLRPELPRPQRRARAARLERDRGRPHLHPPLPADGIGRLGRGRRGRHRRAPLGPEGRVSRPLRPPDGARQPLPVPSRPRGRHRRGRTGMRCLPLQHRPRQVQADQRHAGASDGRRAAPPGGRPAVRHGGPRRRRGALRRRRVPGDARVRPRPARAHRLCRGADRAAERALPRRGPHRQHRRQRRHRDRAAGRARRRRAAALRRHGALRRQGHRARHGAALRARDGRRPAAATPDRDGAAGGR